MFGSGVLEVAIGLIFVFLLFSTICAAIREGIETITKTRAAYLERGLRELLHDKEGIGLAKEFYEHPLIYSLYTANRYVPGPSQKKPGLCPRGGTLPSYIPAKNFAAAMIDIAARGSLPNLRDGTQAPDPALFSNALTADALRAGIAKMENKRVARALLSSLDLAQDDLNKARLNLESWYDASMDRVSGWYKRSTQIIVFLVALFMAGVLNVDAIGIANFLQHNDHARLAIVNKASAAVATGAPRQEGERASAVLDTLDLPIGWPADFAFPSDWYKWDRFTQGVLVFAGWMLTALAATLGAPFWFDTLNRIMVIRSTVKPYEKSGSEGSEDRQDAAQPVAPFPMMQQAAAPAPPVQAAGATAAASDSESAIDGCDLANAPVTPDEDLPPAYGGVQR
jgi:hypothetical protein